MIKSLLKYRNTGLYLGFFAWVLNFIFSFSLEITDLIYQRGVFVLIRLLWDFSFGLLPFPSVYILGIILLVMILRKRKRHPLSKSWKIHIHDASNSLGWLVFLFYILWGFNYSSTPLSNRIAVLNQTQTKKINLEFFTRLITRECEQSWVAQGGAEWTESELRIGVENTLKRYQYNTWGRVRCRVINDKGFMRRLGILGIYLPFVSEGHSDGSQSNFSMPFTCAHEMSHGYGITDEGEANFVAWLSMHESRNPWLRYSASIQLLRSCLFRLRAENQESYLAIRNSLHKEVTQDLEFINDNIGDYPPFFARFSDRVNDIYLKSQGVEKGTKSYGTFVDLAFLWRNLAHKSNCNFH